MQGKHAAEEGEERRPKLNTAKKIKSQLKMGLKEDFNIDLDDEMRYPQLKRKWKAYLELLAREGKSLIYRFIIY